MVVLVVQVLNTGCTFAGSGRWEIRAVHCFSSRSRDDYPLAPNCDVHQQRQEFQHVEGRVGIVGM